MAEPSTPVLIDALQFCSWSRETFEQMHEAGMSAIHATVAYHESFRKTAGIQVRTRLSAAAASTEDLAANFEAVAPSDRLANRKLRTTIH